MDIRKMKSVRRVGLALLCVGVGLLSGGLEVAAQRTITVCAEGCDFAKIQQAIDAAAAGDTIDVKAGTYVENLTIRNKNDLTLQGAGRDQVTLDGNAPNQQNITPGIFITGSRNITVKGFKITNSRRGLETSNSSLLFIEENAFEGNLRQGIALYTRSEARIAGNIVQGTKLDTNGTFGRGIDVQASQATLMDNRITENADCGLHVVFAGGQPSQASGGNNIIQNNKGGDLCGNAPTTLLAEPPAEGTLEQVAVPSEVPTIQEAVNKVKAGGTITVSAGTYQEQVQIYKSLTIRGDGADFTVLQAPGPDWTALNIATDGVQVTLEGLKLTGGRRGGHISTGPAGVVTLRYVKVEGNGNGKPTDAGLRLTEQSTVTLEQVSVSGNQGAGLQIFTNTITIRDSEISKNTDHGLQMTDVTVTIENSTIANNTVRGIAVGGNTRATIQQNTISDNGGYSGIVLFDSSTATIEGNTITGNEESGVWVTDSAQATLTDNQISNNKPDSQNYNGNGIVVTSNGKATIQNNTIERNAHYGISLRQNGQATMQKNTISNNSSRAVELAGNSKATLDDNTIMGNASHGVILWDSTQATITNNRITDTKSGSEGGGQGIAVYGASRATITNNTISSNVANGIILDNSNIPNETTQAEISRNTIQNNRGCGVSAGSDRDIKITGQGNTISGNKGGNLCGDLSKFPTGFGGGK